RVQLAVAELFDELDGLATEPPPGVNPEVPFLLSAGERRACTANTIMRNPVWRKKDTGGALRMSPADAERLGVASGGRVRIATRRGSAAGTLEVSDRVQARDLSPPAA